jgi:hypothetical protein
LLPISGTVFVVPAEGDKLAWPRFQVDGAGQQPGTPAGVTVTDIQPWPFVELVVDGVPAISQGEATRHADTWTWHWSYRVPDEMDYQLIFYRDCHTGCRERGRMAVGVPNEKETEPVPTKLGVVMPRLDRSWHGRSGWVVEITYALRPEETYWGVDDLASRIAVHAQKGLRVLVRIDYDQQQSLPPTGDYVALAQYLAYVRRLARDERLAHVYGYIIGSDYNTPEAVSATGRAITPAWYARIFNGYGEDPMHGDNVVQIVRAENHKARVIVGPLRPWTTDSLDVPLSCADLYAIDVPWLNYMDCLVSLLDASAAAKSRAGVPLSAPDGFDVQAPGRPDVPEMAGTLRADEPLTDLARDAWDGAQAGFRVYEDWLAIINAYPTTRGLPVYIVSTNTYDRAAGVPPAQNYPAGWLTTALHVVNSEVQIEALCWFMDHFPHSDQWDWFSLTEHPGRLVDAAAEFDALLLEETGIP